MSSISAIELHVRTYRSALKSNKPISLKSLVNTYQKMKPLLSGPDSLNYALSRLPACISQIKTVLLGQSPEVFAKAGFPSVRSWPQVTTPSRRRTIHFDKKTATLAVFVASVSDIDDMVNLLLAYQLEVPPPIPDLRLQLLAGSWNDYAKTTQRWWKNIATVTAKGTPNDFSKNRNRIGANRFHMSRQTIYFVSSNTYSLLNLLGQPPSALTIPSSHYLDINTQIIPLKHLAHSKKLDPALKIKKPQTLAKSQALIFNIDYPLGFSAHLVLNEVLQNVAKVKGVYVMGKSAVLNGEVGDIHIPKIVFDEHSQNTYFINNCFNQDFSYSYPQGSIITNQKSVSVLGTFLENKALLRHYSQNNFTIIEMEAGPFLSAITQSTYDQPTPKNTIIDLNSAPFDIGIINYTSDTPYSQVKNLGQPQDNSLLEAPIRLASLAILQRIIHLEEN